MSIVLWAQEAVLLMFGLYWTVWDRYMQVLYLGRALRTKETLPDFLKWRRVTRPPLVFRELTGSQRTPGKWGITRCLKPVLDKLIKMRKMKSKPMEKPKEKPRKHLYTPETPSVIQSSVLCFLLYILVLKSYGVVH